MRFPESLPNVEMQCNVSSNEVSIEIPSKSCLNYHCINIQTETSEKEDTGFTGNVEIDGHQKGELLFMLNTLTRLRIDHIINS